MKTGSLTVVGTGIKAVAHTTLEAVGHIRNAEKLLFLVADAVTQCWLESLNPSAESLQDCYIKGESRSAAYNRITGRILDTVRSGMRVCAAFYGHPGVFVHSSHEVVRVAREEGYAAHMTAGVSAADCLFADLSLDPGVRGCQQFEATFFVARRPRFDPAVPLIIWQPGFVGQSVWQGNDFVAVPFARELASVLEESYAADHDVTLYEASLYAICGPVVQRFPLRSLPLSNLRGASTLYIPPAGSFSAESTRGRPR